MINNNKKAFERFIVERPLYEKLATKIRALAIEAYQRAEILCRVEARAKDVDSLLKKCVTKNKKYEDVGDKAGIRILPVYPDERERAIEVLGKTFDLHDSEEKIDGLKPEVFSYRGHHTNVTLRDEQLVNDADLKGLMCEVQVHSPGECMWASINHDLSYKALTELPRDVLRSLHRISAVLELVDREMSEVRENILKGSDAGVVNTLAACERHFFRFMPRQYNKDLTVGVLHALQEIAETTKFGASIDAFVEKYRDTLTDTFKKRDVTKYEKTLLGQPESVLIFYLLERQAEDDCKKVWPVEPAFFEGLRDAWCPPVDA